MRPVLTTTLLLAVTSLLAIAGFPPEAGAPGSTAIHKDSPLFVRWANGHTNYTLGADVDAMWQTPAKAYGKAVESDTFDIVCLGNGGQITMFLPLPVRDGDGADFAVFENAISHTFLELAFVEVSSNGSDFFRFPTASLTPSAVGPFGEVYPDEIDGFAGKYIKGYGTPFDLASLPDTPLLDKQHVRFIRVIDIIGDGQTKDSSNRPIYDPTRTVGSGGFDLDAIGVIHENQEAVQLLAPVISGETYHLRWESNPGSTYRIQQSSNLIDWTDTLAISGSTSSGQTEQAFPTAPLGTQCFWRISRD